ncbi:MAG: type VI secretion system baseplate subunit TssK [Calditrichaeota bacterium]|nr:MAG: type VI secretion system baseplate subunit TssK [Calditrichota bacterium]
MTLNKKVIWFEGMTLDPHHFQQMDRFHESRLNYWMREVTPYLWGISAITLEKDSLLNGQFQLTKLTGVMPDGMFFNMPESDPLPIPRNFSELFPPTQESLPVFLCIPADKPGGQNYQLKEGTIGHSFRYQLENIRINDENTGTDQREIAMARTNFQTIFGSESLEGMTYLKIAEIIRSPQGDFIENEDFIPACLSVQSSETLLGILRRLLELLNARSTALRTRRRQSTGGQLEADPKDLPLYWHLSSINMMIPVLNQYLTLGKFHPFQVYQLLLQLTGLLTTYSLDDGILPGDLSLYDHTNLGPLFRGIEKKIRRLLGDVVPQKHYISLPLEKQSESLYFCKIEDPALLKEARLFLVCQGEMLEKKPVNELPLKLRIASQEMIHEVLSTATRALNITYSTHPPAGVPSKPGVYYFKLEKQGPFWSAIEKSQDLAVYIPAEYQGVGVELIAVKS